MSLPLARHGVIAGVVLAFARGLGEFGATLLFAGSQPGRRTLAVQLYILYEEPGDAYEQRMWRLVIAAVRAFLRRPGRQRAPATPGSAT